MKILLYHIKLLDNFYNNNKKIILLERFSLSSVKVFSQILFDNGNLNDSEFKIINDLYEQIVLKISNYNLPDHMIFLLAGMFFMTWPLIPTGSFFNNWLSIMYLLPISYYLNEKKILKNKSF